MLPRKTQDVKGGSVMLGVRVTVAGRQVPATENDPIRHAPGAESEWARGHGVRCRPLFTGGCQPIGSPTRGPGNGSLPRCANTSKRVETPDRERRSCPSEPTKMLRVIGPRGGVVERRVLLGDLDAARAVNQPRCTGGGDAGPSSQLRVALRLRGGPATARQFDEIGEQVETLVQAALGRAREADRGLPPTDPQGGKLDKFIVQPRIERRRERNVSAATPDSTGLSFDRLVTAIGQAHAELAGQAARAVNSSLTLRNGLIGFYIAEVIAELASLDARAGQSSQGR